MEIQLIGKRVLVTGSRSGIGTAIAEQMGAAGAKVAVNYLCSEERADDTVMKIMDAGGEAFNHIKGVKSNQRGQAYLF